MLPLVSTFRDVGKFLGISMLQSIPGIVFAYCELVGFLKIAYILPGGFGTIERMSSLKTLFGIWYVR